MVLNRVLSNVGVHASKCASIKTTRSPCSHVLSLQEVQIKYRLVALLEEGRMVVVVEVVVGRGY